MAVLGSGTACFNLDGDVNATVAPIRGQVIYLTHSARVSLQLETEDRLVNQRTAAATNSDAVVASTHTWTFANGAFATTDVGGRLIVIGSQSNDGSYNITSRTSGTVIVTDGVQTNETFTTAVVFVVIPPGTLDGNWLIESSNDFSAGTPMQGQMPTLGREHWTDITSQFRDADGNQIAPVAHGTATTRNQLVQAAPLATRCLRLTFTPTAGSGRALGLVGGGDYGV